VRGGLVGWLDAQEDLTVVGEAADGQEALALVAAAEPDVVLRDLRMPRMDGVTATERLSAAHPAVRVLVLTTYDTDADTCGPSPPAPPATCSRTRRCRSWPRPSAPPPAGRRCSRRRWPRDWCRACGHRRSRPRRRGSWRWLAGVARGLTNAEIGWELFIGEATVKTHLLRVFAKLGVYDRTRAVMDVVGRGVLPHPGDEVRLD
jgi:CheY-like chemotaxis protein